MVKSRKIVAAIVTTALVWMAVAGGFVTASSAAAKLTNHWRTHTQTLANAASQAHHADGDTHEHLAAPSDQTNERECAAACLGTIEAKLLPAATVVSAPETIDVDAAVLIATPVSVTSAVLRPAYWPAAPPDFQALACTGAARIIARCSHLRI